MKIIKITEPSSFHCIDGIPNQDSIHHWLVSNGILGICVADGCSSAAWSNIGSSELIAYISFLFREQRFVKKMMPYLSKELAEGIQADSALFDKKYRHALFNMIFDSLNDFIEKLLGKYCFVGNLYVTNGLTVKDFATTMTLLFIEKNTGRMTSISVGDSFACAKQFDKILYLAEPENNGSPNKSFFITSENLKSHLRLKYSRLSYYSFILISTDGLTRIHDNLDDFLRSLHFSSSITSEAIEQVFLGNEPLPDDVGFVLLINDAYDEKEG